MKNLQQINQGNTADIYAFGDGKILKLYKRGMPQEACKTEFYITQQVYRRFGVCPQAFECMELDGRMGAVYEKVEGATLLQEMMRHLTKVKRFADQFARCHISMQQYEAGFVLPSVQCKLQEAIRQVLELTDTEKAYLNRYIDSLPNGNNLCHFDFHPDNIIMRDGEPVIIDWMTACRGDKLADVARTSIMLRFAEVSSKSKIQRTVVKKFQHIIYRQYIKTYTGATGTKLHDIQKWEVPVAAARLCEWLPQTEKKRLLAFVRTGLKDGITLSFATRKRR